MNELEQQVDIALAIRKACIDFGRGTLSFEEYLIKIKELLERGYKIQDVSLSDKR